jgi:hypothetical protein
MDGFDFFDRFRCHPAVCEISFPKMDRSRLVVLSHRNGFAYRICYRITPERTVWVRSHGSNVFSYVFMAGFCDLLDPPIYQTPTGHTHLEDFFLRGYNVEQWRCSTG